MIYLEIAALVVLGVILRLLFCKFWPYRPCRWCRWRAAAKKRRLHTKLLLRLVLRPGRTCWRCHGTKVTRRWGAWHAAKMTDSVIRAFRERGAG